MEEGGTLSAEVMDMLVPPGFAGDPCKIPVASPGFAGDPCKIPVAPRKIVKPVPSRKVAKAQRKNRKNSDNCKAS